MIDEDREWTAACFAVEDTAFNDVQHGIDGDATLCGIASSLMTIVRNPFYGNGARDCRSCARELSRLGRLLVPFVGGFERSTPASVAQVRAAEATLGVALPADLLALYRNSDGAFSTTGQWWLVWPLAQMAEAKEWLGNVPGYGNEWLPFGDDGTGDPFCLQRADGGVTRLSMIDLTHEPVAVDLGEFWVHVERG